MAYFSNSSDGGVLDAQCGECLPYDQCPVAFVQMMYNYDQIGNDQLKECLTALVDENGACQMKQFVSPRLTPPLPGMERVNEQDKGFTG